MRVVALCNWMQFAENGGHAFHDRLVVQQHGKCVVFLQQLMGELVRSMLVANGVVEGLTQRCHRLHGDGILHDEIAPLHEEVNFLLK